MDEKEQIRQILFKNDRNISWLRSKLEQKGLHADVYYLLSDKSVNMDKKIYDAVMDIFRDEGYLTEESSICDHFTTQLFNTNSILSSSLSLLNATAAQCVSDGVLDFNERRRLMDIVEGMESKVKSEIVNLKKMIAGGK